MTQEEEVISTLLLANAKIKEQAATIESLRKENEELKRIKREWEEVALLLANAKIKEQAAYNQTKKA